MGYTALKLAIDNRHISVLSFLASHKDADLSLEDKEGMTVVHWAALYGTGPVLGTLLHVGRSSSSTGTSGKFDINVRNSKGETCLHYLVRNGSNSNRNSGSDAAIGGFSVGGAVPDCLQKLINLIDEHGADVRRTDSVSSLLVPRWIDCY